MSKKNAQNLFKLQIFLFFSEALTMYEKNKNIYNLNKFCVFFIHIYTYTYNVIKQLARFLLHKFFVTAFL